MREKVVRIGNRYIGGGFPIAIQSMCNTKTENVEATVNQILKLEAAGCEIVRVAVPTMEAANAIRKIKESIHIPLVADIHFDYRLALSALHNGIDKIRLNPGNMGSRQNVSEVVSLAREKGVPIRIGVNGGSLEKELYQKYGGVTAEALVESALRHVEILDELNFSDIVISLKASDIPLTVESYRLLSKKVSYPLHLGITEAGTTYTGTIKSAIGIGILLFDGIGSTIRVSLTDDPVEEIKAARKILEVMGLRQFGVKLISCPTCGRTEVDLVRIANLLEEKVKGIEKNITLAVMGCAVNGPGEAREADIGIAGGKNEFLLFKKGIVVRKLKEEEVVSAVLAEIDSL